MRRFIRYLIAAAVLTAIISCSAKHDNNSKKELIIGFGPSTYADQFIGGIQPILERQGYKVTVKIFSQNLQMNPALVDGSVDANVTQSLAYADYYNAKHNVHIAKLATTASAPQSLRSLKHKSLDEISDGSVIAVSNNPIDQERSARLLEQLGIVKINPAANVAQFSLRDIIISKPKIILKELDPALVYRSLADVDFAIINGNYVVNAGDKISDALAIEKTPPQHTVIVAVMEPNLSSQWAQDLKAAYQSKEFENYIKSQDKYAGFIYPPHWDKN